jgi:hypothetical protein
MEVSEGARASQARLPDVARQHSCPGRGVIEGGRGNRIRRRIGDSSGQEMEVRMNTFFYRSESESI